MKVGDVFLKLVAGDYVVKGAGRPRQSMNGLGAIRGGAIGGAKNFVSSTVMGRGWVGGFWAGTARGRLSARVAMVRRGPSFICERLLMKLGPRLTIATLAL